MSRLKINLSHVAPQLKQASQQIVISYSSQDQSIQHLNRGRLPSRETIIAILAAVQELIFPGYFGILGLDESNIGDRTHSLVCSLFEDLSHQVGRCLLLKDPAIQLKGSQTLAEQYTLAFIEAIPQLRQLLSLDIQAAYDGDPAAHNYDEIIFAYPGIYAVMVYRIAHCLDNLAVPLIPRIMTEHAHSLTGIDIHPRAEIGASLFIDHGTGVVIGETATIGKNVKIYQGVTLGALSFPKDAGGQLIRGQKRHPTIEDNVVIYSGATILGGDTIIGAGSVIGGNVWLTHSVPPGTKVIIEEPPFRISKAHI